MRAMILTAAVVLVPLAGAAQQPGTAKTSAAGDAKAITAVGCLQAGAQPNQYVLVTTADSLSKGVAVAVSGTVPNVTYQLSGGSNLGAHVGHRVEITGNSSGKASKAVATDSSVQRERIPDKPDPKVEVKEKAAIEVRDLEVKSLKMVSTDCAAK